MCEFHSLLMFVLLKNWCELRSNLWLGLLLLRFCRLNLIFCGIVFLKKVFIGFLHKFLNLGLRNHLIHHLLLKLVVVWFATEWKLIVVSLADCCGWLLGYLRHFEVIAGCILYWNLAFSICTEPWLLLIIEWCMFLHDLLLILLAHLYEDVLVYFADVDFMPAAVRSLDDLCLRWQVPCCDELLLLIVVVWYHI